MDDNSLIIKMVNKDEKVLIGFNIAITWISFDVDQATMFAHDLLANVKEIEDKRNAH